MKRRKIAIAALCGLLVLTLAGCADESLAERAANKAECESLGGTYEEFVSGMDLTYNGWECWLDKDKE